VQTSLPLQKAQAAHQDLLLQAHPLNQDHLDLQDLVLPDQDLQDQSLEDKFCQ
jgi:hypothetical protein